MCVRVSRTRKRNDFFLWVLQRVACRGPSPGFPGTFPLNARVPGSSSVGGRLDWLVPLDENPVLCMKISRIWKR